MKGESSQQYRDRGGATVVLVGVIAVMLMLVGGLSTAARVFFAGEEARAAADEAALAGASAHSQGAGAPCSVASHLAGINHARLVRCDVLGDSVQVLVEVKGPLHWTASGLARAGAPETSSNLTRALPEIE